MSKKEVNNRKAGIDTGKQLSEDDLNGVSGGLFGITLIDTCQQKYDYNHCCNNFGDCPQLDIIGEHSEIVNGRKVRTFTCSCKKGYFQYITDTH